MPAEHWTEGHRDALLNAWGAEIERALGGAADEPARELIASVVLRRQLLLDLDPLAQGMPDKPGNAIRLKQAGCLVGMAVLFRALGLTCHDVHRLDLSRRRRAGGR